MNRTRNLLLIALLTLSYTACKKDKKQVQETSTTQTTTPATPTQTTAPTATVAPKPIDTIKPMSYLPVYPGSYWNYSDGSSSTTSATYQKDAYAIYSSSGVFKSDTFYVPVYNGRPIWRYNEHNETAVNTYGSPTQPFVAVLSETAAVGFDWTLSFGGHMGRGAQIQAKDTSITIGATTYSPTIVVYQYMFFNNPNGGTTIQPSMRQYYTRDIGLVKEEVLNGSNGSVWSEKHLVTYFINK